MTYIRTRSISRLALVALVAVAVAALPLAARAQSPVSFSAVGGLSIPIGDLNSSGNIGLSLGLRGEGRRMASGWAIRGDVMYDTFGGRGGIDNLSYWGLSGNLVHRATGSTMYQYGGLGMYVSRVAPRGPGNDASDTNLGAQLGLGVDLTSDKRVFGEFGLASAFTSGRSSAWFPIRIGLRF